MAICGNLRSASRVFLWNVLEQIANDICLDCKVYFLQATIWAICGNLRQDFSSAYKMHLRKFQTIFVLIANCISCKRGLFWRPFGQSVAICLRIFPQLPTYKDLYKKNIKSKHLLLISYAYLSVCLCHTNWTYITCTQHRQSAKGMEPKRN